MNSGLIDMENTWKKNFFMFLFFFAFTSVHGKPQFGGILSDAYEKQNRNNSDYSNNDGQDSQSTESVTGESGPVVLRSKYSGLTKEALEEKQCNQKKTSFLDDMLVGYDQRIRPNNNDAPVKTSVSIFVNSFYSVNEQSMDYKLNIFLRLRWNDPRLAHNFSTNPTAVHASMLANIWKPDVFFSNEKHADYHSVTTENKLLRVYNNGDIYSSVRITLTLSCDMHLHHFPMDVQVCNLKMESFGYDMKSLIFDWTEENAVQMPESLQLPQFLIRGYRVKKCTKVYSTGSFTCLVAEFILQRQMGYYIIQMYAPSCLIVILSWVAFWINMDATPARTALGITTVLTMTTQSSGARVSLPKVSYVKAIDLWFAVCLIFVFGALLEFAIVNFLSRREKSFSKFKPTLKYLADNIRQRKGNVSDTEVCTPDELIALNSVTISSEPFPTAREKKQDDIKSRWSLKAKRIDQMSRILFPLVFIVFNLFYWMAYMISRNDLVSALEGAIPYQE